jgi:TPR repeat protein
MHRVVEVHAGERDARRRVAVHHPLHIWQVHAGERDARRRVAVHHPLHIWQVHAGERYAIAVWFYDSPRSRALGTAPWVREAAEAGNADAQFLQASFCAQGRFGNRRDDDAAAQWLARGAAQGHATSQLGYARQLLGAGDEERAAAYLKLAAEQGHVEAMYSLALCYLDGMGVPRSADDAAEWFGRAAEEGGEFGEAAAMELAELSG